VTNLFEIFVRYGEIGLKSPPVRRLMEKQLANNIRINFDKIGLTDFKIKINRSWGRLIVYTSPEAIENNPSIIKKAIFILTKYVFGITSVSPVIRTSSDLEDIKQISKDLVNANIKNNTSFVVRARRTGNHEYSSLELERLIGEEIYETYAKEKNLRVNLRNPDYTLNIEVRDEFAFIFDEKYDGFGGLPQGTQGNIASILRGSMEDAIAGFLLCKRGATILPIIFRKQIDQFVSNEKALSEQTRIIDCFQPMKKRFYYEVDFDQILNEIGYKKLNCSICDKICIGITERIVANKLKLGITLGNHPKAILSRNPEKNFGEKFIPIYYPLIALNSKEINHPFDIIPKKQFCLAECPGYKNQKKKRVKPTTQEEINDIVANAKFEFRIRN